MGGHGSGNHYRWDARETTERANRIDIRLWHRGGYLRPRGILAASWSHGDIQLGSIGGYVASRTRIVLVYRTRRRDSGEWCDMREPIDLEWTACNYGGERPWFLCPACRRRVAVLYGPGARFACRHCYSLAYASTREAPHDRLLRKAQAIRERLGGSANIYSPFPQRPKGMHHRTYERLFREYVHYERESLIEAAKWLDKSFQDELDQP